MAAALLAAFRLDCIARPNCDHRRNIGEFSFRHRFVFVSLPCRNIATKRVVFTYKARILLQRVCFLSIDDSLILGDGRGDHWRNG